MSVEHKVEGSRGRREEPEDCDAGLVPMKEEQEWRTNKLISGLMPQHSSKKLSTKLVESFQQKIAY